MIDTNALCEKIRQLHPEAGRCGIEVDVGYDAAEKSLVVYLRKDERRIKHFLSEAWNGIVGADLVLSSCDPALFVNQKRRTRNADGGSCLQL